MLKLKNWHYPSYKGHFYLCANGKRMRFWTFADAFGSFRRFRRVVKADSIHMYSATESGRSESGPFVIDDFFFTFFIGRASVEDTAASECIRTVGATHGCKILQLYEYDANVYRYDANCE